jgi:hypothetical protein
MLMLEMLRFRLGCMRLTGESTRTSEYKVQRCKIQSDVFWKNGRS